MDSNDLLVNAILLDLHGKFGSSVKTVYSKFNHDAWGHEVTVIFANNRHATTIFNGREIDPEFLALCALLYDLPEA